MRLSIVTSLYQSRATVDEFIHRSVAAATELAGDDWEIILVNDGCDDGTVEHLLDRRDAAGRITVVDLALNAGHHAALIEGLSLARGEFIFLLDSDLEEAPEWLSRFKQVLDDQSADLVFGFQERRSGNVWRRATGGAAWWIIRRMTQLDLPASTTTARLMTRRFLDAFLTFQERAVNLGGVFALTGFVQVPIEIEKEYKGHSHYPFRRKLWHLVNAIVGFSTTALSMVFVAGMLISAIAVVFLSYIVLAALFWNQPPLGWSSVMVSVWLLGGVTISSIGIVALYLGKILVEVKARPRAIVRAIFTAN